MKENKLYAKLQPYLIRWGEADRVENILGSGMSDIFYNIEGTTGWIETKVLKQDLLYFEKFQPNWMRKHTRIGLNRIFVVAIDSKESILVWKASRVVNGVFVPKEKWLTFDIKQAAPDLVMPKPYVKWLSFKEMLVT